jgi:hypothetical protein
VKTKSGDEFRAALNQIMPKKVDAYHSMYSAASQYFRALQNFEINEFNEADLDVADKSCKDADGKALLADDDARDAFYDFWQLCTDLKERGEKRKDTPEGLRTIWRDGRGRQLGQEFNRFGSLLSNKLKEALA